MSRATLPHILPSVRLLLRRVFQSIAIAPLLFCAFSLLMWIRSLFVADIGSIGRLSFKSNRGSLRLWETSAHSANVFFDSSWKLIAALSIFLALVLFAIARAIGQPRINRPS